MFFQPTFTIWVVSLKRLHFQLKNPSHSLFVCLATENGLTVLAPPCFALFCMLYSSWILATDQTCQLVTTGKVREISRKQVNRLPDLTFISMLFPSREPLLKVRLISFIFCAGRRQVESPFDIPSLFSYIVRGYLVFLGGNINTAF